ncbi:hypothetical protein RclHR1_13450004 [Rhizophagus clarus]|uniref:Uncharacterized protein n=1 Tax=Rhizophagus clarus TaxID=94130 RepID=A0A2Z6R2F7_9GLOM|nr:hypothetical protein RclHR1_13450004 [Rhizophagus clarus]
MPQGFFQHPYDDQTKLLVSQFGDQAHPQNYQRYSEYLAIPGTLISLLFHLSERVAHKVFEPVDVYLAMLVDETADDKDPESEDLSHDEMDDIIVDTNQQSSRIILEVPPKPTPVIATSSTMTAKSSKDKSGEKIPLSQPTKGRDRPNPGQKSHDKKSRRIDKIIVMQEFPVHLKNSIRDVTFNVNQKTTEILTVRVKIAFNQFTLQAFDGRRWCHWLHNLEVRWFSGRWMLKQRMNHSIFSAKVDGLPVSVTTDPLLVQDYDKCDSFFKDQGIRAYKFLKQGANQVTMLGFFETYEDLKTALESPFVYERTKYKWYHSSSCP